MKKQIRKLLHRFENLKFRKKLSVLMLIAGLVPVVFLAFSMQYGMTNQLREKEQYNLEKILEQYLPEIVEKMDNGSGITAKGLAKAVAPYIDSDLGSKERRKRRGN